MEQNALQFKRETLWEQKHKLCKLKDMSNGNLVGNFSDNFALVIEKQKKWVNGGLSNTEFESVAYLVPIKHTKVV